MNRKLRVMACLFAATALLLCSCARMPSEKKSAKIIHKYFEKYGKKYPTTPFGESKISQVDVTSREEIHKNLVAIDAFLTYKDGSVQRVNTTIGKGAFGWKFRSWENATNL